MSEPSIQDRLTALYESKEQTEAPQEEAPQEEIQQEQQVESKEPEQQLENEQEVDDNEVSSKDQGASEDSETSEIETLSDIALAMGKTEEEILGSIKAKTKVNGVETEISLNEVIAGYQRNQDYTHGKMALSDEKKSFQSEVETFRQEQEARITQANAISNHLEQEFLNSFNSVDWDGLRVDDPAEFAAKRAEFTEKQNQLIGIKQQVATEAQQLIQEQQAEFNSKNEARVVEEANKIKQLIPEWSDVKVAQNEFAEVSNFLTEIGYSDTEISNIIDHRDIITARYAMLYLKSQKNTDIAKQKVKNVPKLLKPGTPKSTAQKNSEGQKKLRSRAKKTGSVEDAAKRYAAILSNS